MPCKGYAKFTIITKIYGKHVYHMAQDDKIAQDARKTKRQGKARGKAKTLSKRKIERFSGILHLARLLLRAYAPVSSIYGHSVTDRSQKDENYLLKRLTP